MNLLLIEDEVKTAQTLKIGLEESGFRLDLALTGNAGLEMALNNNYHLIITDLILPDIGGIDICRKIRLNDHSTPILMLTALGSIEEKLIGFDSGADDYLVKPFEFKELLARIKSLIKRTSLDFSEKQFLWFSDLSLDLNTKKALRNNQNIDLTPREFDLLKYFIENTNKVISKKDIAEKVWQIHFDTGTNTIEVYINYLRNKIDKNFEKKLIHTVHGMGYILKEDNAD